MTLADAPRRWWSSLSRPARGVVLVMFAVLLALLPVVEPPLLTTPDTDFSGVLFLVGVYCLCALGLNIVVGLAGLLDLGYVGFFAVGAYTLAVLGSPDSRLGTALPWLLCIPAAVAVSLVAGVILGGPTLRLRGDYLAIVTLGFGEIVRLTAVNSDLLGGAAGITSVPRPPGQRADGAPFFGIIDVRPFYWLVLATIFLVVWAGSNLEHSRVGRAWVAIREDEDAAQLMGVPTFRFKLWAFAMGAAVGGLSGAFFASRQAFINPETFPVQTSMMFLAAVIVGGAGNKLGVVLGAVIVAYLPERLRGLDEPLLVTWYLALVLGLLVYLLFRRPETGRRSLLRAAALGLLLAAVPPVVLALPEVFGTRGEIGQLRYLVFGLALIVMSVFRPQGLLPSRRRATELADRAQEVRPRATS
jgi:branched-chain amino acid transport system permease protein